MLLLSSVCLPWTYPLQSSSAILCSEIISSLYCLPKQGQTLASTYKIFHGHFHRPLNPGFQFLWSTDLDLVTSLTSSSVCTPSECLVTLEIRPQSHCSSPCIHFCVTPACVSLHSYFTAPFLSQPYLLTQTWFLLAVFHPIDPFRPFLTLKPLVLCNSQKHTYSHFTSHPCICIRS